MNKLHFRARQLDVNKPISIYKFEDFADISDLKDGPRTVAPIPSGMEKEEESEYHIQQAIRSQKVTVKGVVIPTPSVEFSEDYDELYKGNFALPKQFIHVQPFDIDDNQPDYDLDTEDENWASELNGKLKLESSFSLTTLEQMMDCLEKASDHQIISFDETKLLIKENDTFLKFVYEHWYNKRSLKGSPLILRVLTEKKSLNGANQSATNDIAGPDNSGTINPYIAFRRRAEKMQTRKNRKNDECSYEKMLKIKRDSLKAKNLIELVKEREKHKHQFFLNEYQLFQFRYLHQDFSGEMYSECMKQFSQLIESKENNILLHPLNGFKNKQLSPFKDQYHWGNEPKRRSSQHLENRLNYKMYLKRQNHLLKGAGISPNKSFNNVGEDESLAPISDHNVLLPNMFGYQQDNTVFGSMNKHSLTSSPRKRASFRNLSEDFYYTGIGGSTAVNSSPSTQRRRNVIQQRENKFFNTNTGTKKSYQKQNFDSEYYYYEGTTSMCWEDTGPDGVKSLKSQHPIKNRKSRRKIQPPSHILPFQVSFPISKETPFGPLHSSSYTFNKHLDPYTLYKRYLCLKLLLTRLKTHCNMDGSFKTIELNETKPIRRFIVSLKSHLKTENPVSFKKEDIACLFYLPHKRRLNASFFMPLFTGYWRSILDKPPDSLSNINFKFPILRETRLGTIIDQNSLGLYAPTSLRYNPFDHKSSSNHKIKNNLLSFLDQSSTPSDLSVDSLKPYISISRLRNITLRSDLLNLHKRIKYPTKHSYSTIHAFYSTRDKHIGSVMPCLSNLFRDAGTTVLPYSNITRPSADPTNLGLVNNQPSICKTLRTYNSSTVVYTNSAFPNPIGKRKRMLSTELYNSPPLGIGDQQQYNTPPPLNTNKIIINQHPITAPITLPYLGAHNSLTGIITGNASFPTSSNLVPLAPNNLFIESNNKNFIGQRNMISKHVAYGRLENNNLSLPTSSLKFLLQNNNPPNENMYNNPTNSFSIPQGTNNFAAHQQYLLLKQHNKNLTNNCLVPSDHNQILRTTGIGLPLYPSNLPGSDMTHTARPYLTNYAAYVSSQLKNCKSSFGGSSSTFTTTGSACSLSSLQNLTDQQQQALAAAAAIQVQLNNLNNLLLSNSPSPNVNNNHMLLQSNPPSATLALKPNNNNINLQNVIPLNQFYITNNNSSVTTCQTPHNWLPSTNFNPSNNLTTPRANKMNLNPVDQVIITSPNLYLLPSRNAVSSISSSSSSMNNILFHQQPYLVRDSLTGDYVIKSSLTTALPNSGIPSSISTLKTNHAPIHPSTEFNNNLTSLSSYIFNLNNNANNATFLNTMNNAKLVQINTNQTNHNNNLLNKLPHSNFPNSSPLQPTKPISSFLVGNSNFTNVTKQNIPFYKIVSLNNLNILDPPPNMNTMISNNSSSSSNLGISYGGTPPNITINNNLSGKNYIVFNNNINKPDPNNYNCIATIASNFANSSSCNRNVNLLNEPGRGAEIESPNNSNNQQLSQSSSKFRTLSLLIPSGSSLVLNNPSLCNVNNIQATTSRTISTTCINIQLSEPRCTPYSTSSSSSSILNGLLEQDVGVSAVVTTSHKYNNKIKDLGPPVSTLSSSSSSNNLIPITTAVIGNLSSTIPVTSTTSPTFSPTIVNLFAIT